MTGVKWVRLEATFPDNPKILQLAYEGKHRAAFVYVCGLAYAGAQGNEGWIPHAALTRLHGRKADAAHLVTAGLWTPRPGGWEIHDWLDYQPTNDTIAARTARARAGAAARWAMPQAMPQALPQALPQAMHIRTNERTNARDGVVTSPDNGHVR